MCVAAIAWQASPRWHLVAAANRDEYHARPAAPLARWADGSGVIAGRDLEAGGTWLGLTEGDAAGTGAGRLALVTNFRVAGYPRPGRPSRGGLVTGLLAGAAPHDLPLAECNPCNLLHVDGGGADAAAARFLTNYPAPAALPLAPGVHGVSNGPVDAPWLKTRRLAAALTDWVAADSPGGFDPLFAALLDPAPTTREWTAEGPEPRFSAIFVADPVYGTRCSTVIAVDRAGHGQIVERSFTADGTPAGEVSLGFRWPVPPA